MSILLSVFSSRNMVYFISSFITTSKASVFSSYRFHTYSALIFPKQLKHFIVVLTQISNEMWELLSCIQYVCVNHISELRVISFILRKFLCLESTEYVHHYTPSKNNYILTFAFYYSYLCFVHYCISQGFCNCFKEIVVITSKVILIIYYHSFKTVVN